MQGNQNRWCGPLMRSNCCCDSHSTTMWVSCKKGSISSAARTRACSPPLLLLLLWDVAGLRGRRQEVEGRGDGVIILESREGCVIGFLHPETRFKKVCFQDPYWRSAKTMQYMCVFAKECCRLGRGLKLCVLSWTSMWVTSARWAQVWVVGSRSNQHKGRSSQRPTRDLQDSVRTLPHRV